MIRKDFITVEGHFPEIGDGLAEVPTKAEYDDFIQRVNAAFELRDKEIDELKDRIAALETKNGATKSTSKVGFESSETLETLGIRLLARELKLKEQEIKDSFSRREPYYVRPGVGYVRNLKDALSFVKQAFDLAGWNSSEFNFTVERVRHTESFIVTITAI